MNKTSDFRKHAHQFVDWMADYFENIENYPVKSQVEPKEIFNQIPSTPPSSGEAMEKIMQDFQQIIMPGITHWQSPNFMAYFPSNASYPSILAEMLISTLSAQCMIWETSPAAAELEEMMMIWLRQMTGLPDFFEGVIQDTASTATLCAILTAREQSTNYSINKTGFSNDKKLRAYCSSQTHSSIEKGIKIAGFGKENLVKIAVDEKLQLIPEALEEAIKKDLAAGFTPCFVTAALGTTSTTAIDPLKEIAAICKKYNVWLHVDAAYAGSALVLPEYRWMIEGVEDADSFVFNPHKWLFTNFDCSAYFVKDKAALIRTFSILPEYLKTETLGKVNDYRDWGVQLGRRFRALKLWFVIRSFGTTEIQEKIRTHITLVKQLEVEIEKHPDYEILAPTTMNLICFRYHPSSIHDEEQLNQLNEQLLHQINKTGKLYLTHTKIENKYTIRLVAANTVLEIRHLDQAWALIQDLAIQEKEKMKK